MAVYKFVELVGTSPNSWEEAAASAVKMAAETLRDIRIAEVVKQDITVEDNKIRGYRTKVKVSFKVEAHNM